MGDYEAFLRTPPPPASNPEKLMVVGDKRMSILKGAKVGQISALPWQTPLMVWFEAETKRRDLPAAKKKDLNEKKIEEAKKLTWKELLGDYYRAEAAMLAKEAKVARAAELPVGTPQQPSMTDLLGLKVSPGSTGTEEEDTKMPAEEMGDQEESGEDKDEKEEEESEEDEEVEVPRAKGGRQRGQTGTRLRNQGVIA